MDNNSYNQNDQQGYYQQPQQPQYMQQPQQPQYMQQPQQGYYQQPQYMQQPQQGYYQQQPQYVPAAQPVPGKGIGITGMVLSIVAIFLTVIFGLVFLTTMVEYSDYWYYDSALEAAANYGATGAYIIFSLFALAFAIPGIILSAKSKAQSPSGINKAGFVMSMISIIVMGLIFVVSVFATAIYA